MGFRACSNLLLRWGSESFQWSLLSPLDSIELPSPLQSNPRSFSLVSDQFACFMKWESGDFHRLFESIAEPTPPVLPSSQSQYSPAQSKSKNANLKSTNFPSKLEKLVNSSSSFYTMSSSNTLDSSKPSNSNNSSSSSNSSSPLSSSSSSSSSTLSASSSLGWSLQNTSHRLYNPVSLSLIYFAPILSLFLFSFPLIQSSALFFLLFLVFPNKQTHASPSISRSTLS